MVPPYVIWMCGAWVPLRHRAGGDLLRATFKLFYLVFAFAFHSTWISLGLACTASVALFGHAKSSHKARPALFRLRALRVHVGDAVELVKTKARTDPEITVIVGSVSRTSKRKVNTLTPNWNESFDFQGLCGAPSGPTKAPPKGALCEGGLSFQVLPVLKRRYFDCCFILPCSFDRTRHATYGQH